MINDSEIGEFRIVLVYEYDRFFREQDEAWHYQYLLKLNKVVLYSVTELFYSNQLMNYVMIVSVVNIGHGTSGFATKA